MRPAGGAGETLLLCLDLQPVFLRAVGAGPGLLGRCQFAVASALGLGIPVAFTEQVPAKLGRTDPSLLSLAEAGEVHSKETFSAFADGSAVRTALLDGRNLGHVLICGVETPICVYQSALDALRAGVAVTVLADCVGARREADARMCLESLAGDGVRILPAETVFYCELARRGGVSHPFFRTYTELVKKHA